MKQSLEDSRWQDTLEALESIKASKSLDEAGVNTWLNSWGTGAKIFPLNDEDKVFAGVN